MSVKLNNKIQWFLKKFGEPETCKMAEAVTINQYRNRLPDILLELWKEFGFCRFKDGLFFIVDPHDYYETAAAWLKGTGLLDIDTFHVIGRSGFGELFLWGERTGQHFNIEVLDGSIFDNGSSEIYIQKNGNDDAFLNFLTVIKPMSLDKEDSKSEIPIFDDAVANFGSLNTNEMFTFEPAPFLGGNQTIESINKVNFFIQSEILVSMGQREILDIKTLTRRAFDR